MFHFVRFVGYAWITALLPFLVMLAVVSKKTGVSVRRLLTNDFDTKKFLATPGLTWKPESTIARIISVPVRLWVVVSVVAFLVTLYIGAAILSPLAKLYRNQTGRYLLESDAQRQAGELLEKFSGRIATDGEGSSSERSAQMFLNTLAILLSRLDDKEVIEMLYLHSSAGEDMFPCEILATLRRMCDGEITTQETRGLIEAEAEQYRALFEKAGLLTPAKITSIHFPQMV